MLLLLLGPSRREFLAVPSERVLAEVGWKCVRIGIFLLEKQLIKARLGQHHSDHCLSTVDTERQRGSDRLRCEFERPASAAAGPSPTRVTRAQWGRATSDPGRGRLWSVDHRAPKLCSQVCTCFPGLASRPESNNIRISGMPRYCTHAISRGTFRVGTPLAEPFHKHWLTSANVVFRTNSSPPVINLPMQTHSALPYKALPNALPHLRFPCASHVMLQASKAGGPPNELF